MTSNGTVERRCVCGRVGQAGEAHCGGCGKRLRHGGAANPNSTPPRIPTQRTGGHERAPSATATDTTRLLCAAAHLDPEYADACLAEYLVEETRAMARAPGVEASAVLGDAVAANTRRRIRDGLLIVFALLLALTTQLMAPVVWLVIALVHRGVAHPDRPRRTARSALTLGLIVLGVVLVPAVLATSLVASLDVGIAGGSVLGVLLLPVFGVPAVLLGEEFLTYRIVRSAFRRGRFDPHPTSSTLRTLGRSGAAARLGRVHGTERFDPSSEREGPDAEVVVFRGPSPFVGTGTLVERRAPVFPLKRTDARDRRPVALDEGELHGAIRRSVTALARPSSLSPHGRLGALSTHEQLLVDADTLVAHYPDDEARTFLPSPAQRPESRLASRAARHVLRNPREWVRYYQLFQVEGWDRDLTVSCHVAVGTDQGMLALEWALCVLPPVAPEYRTLTDDRRALTRYVLDRALSDLIDFPLSLGRRLRRVVHPFRAIPADPGELVGAKYGAGRSLRELGAAAPESYFHDVDIARYVGVFERSILEAVRTHLEARGLSVADLDRVVAATYNNIVEKNHGAVTFGAGSAASVGPGGQGESA